MSTYLFCIACKATTKHDYMGDSFATYCLECHEEPAIKRRDEAVSREARELMQKLTRLLP